MQQTDTMIIARQGWPYVGGAIAAFAIFIVLEWGIFQFLALVAMAIFAYMYRNPERIVPPYQDHSIVSIADGRISTIETMETAPFMDGPCYKVEIISSMFHTALLRMPFTGKVDHFELRRGSRMPTIHPLAPKLNEQVTIGFKGDGEQYCMCEHTLDRSLDALSVTTHSEAQILQGGRYGLMVKGSHTLYLPVESRVAVKVGDEVRAGETLIGYFS